MQSELITYTTCGNLDRKKEANSAQPGCKHLRSLAAKEKIFAKEMLSGHLLGQAFKKQFPETYVSKDRNNNSLGINIINEIFQCLPVRVR